MGKSKVVGSFTVKSKTSSTMAGQSRLFSFGANLQGAIGSLRAPDRPGSAQCSKTAGKAGLELRRDTHLMAKEMANDPAVEFAEPNYLIRPLSVEPNDQYYGLQWHYGAIDLPNAWSTTTGIASTRIAVLDTGIADHPDIASRLTADGFDFVSSLGNSGDGDGIDGDPTDPGDGKDNTQCGDLRNA